MSHERILIWYSKGRIHARQGVHAVSSECGIDPIRQGEERKRAEWSILRLLYDTKRKVQQMKRPPAPDSRPLACFAKYRGEMLVCTRCSAAWSVKADPYPECRGPKP